ncbi:MAG TPA: cell division protein FtsL [Polyangia bacterium]|jgi:Cell division protein FtsL.|nr:cell division protein FtsL [Polyangia bacterium]
MRSPLSPGALPQAAALLDPGRHRQGAGLAVIAFVVLGLTLGALGHVAVHAKRLEVALALGEAERVHRELAEQRRHLEIEIGMLKDPSRVIAIARDQLLMQPAAPENIRRIGTTPVAPGKGTR